MSCWNDKYEGDIQIECPICGTKMKKKRRTYHLTECYEKHSSLVADMGLIKCPLNRLHVIPIVHLNHHLEGNCEEAQNALRRYFHRAELRVEMKKPPENFLADVLDEVLNGHNKKLLYLLRKDLSGRDITDNKELYPDPADPPKSPQPPATTPGATTAQAAPGAQ